MQGTWGRWGGANPAILPAMADIARMAAGISTFIPPTALPANLRVTKIWYVFNLPSLKSGAEQALKGLDSQATRQQFPMPNTPITARLFLC